VEQSVPFAAVRPWRLAALIAGALAALELVMLVVAGVALLAKPLSHHARRQAIAARRSHRAIKPPQEGAPSLRRRQTAVVVLNGNGRAGAAGSEAARVRGRGYIVRDVGNAPKMSYLRSVVMFRRGYRPEALRLARDLGIGIVGPLDGLRRADLHGAHLAVVVGD
jgi:hypothetical protein